MSRDKCMGSAQMKSASVGRTERSEFRLESGAELPERAGARSGLRNKIQQLKTDRALVA